MERASAALASLVRMDDAVLAPHHRGPDLTELVGREFVEALSAGLRRSAAAGLRASGRQPSPPAPHDAPVPHGSPDGPGPAAGDPGSAGPRQPQEPHGGAGGRGVPEVAARTTAMTDPACRQIVASTRLLEKAVAALPPGHPAGDQAIRALTRAIDRIVARSGAGPDD